MKLLLGPSERRIGIHDLFVSNLHCFHLDYRKIHHKLLHCARDAATTMASIQARLIGEDDQRAERLQTPAIALNSIWLMLTCP